MGIAVRAGLLLLAVVSMLESVLRVPHPTGVSIVCCMYAGFLVLSARKMAGSGAVALAGSARQMIGLRAAPKAEPFGRI
jgi:hypothetical protein